MGRVLVLIVARGSNGDEVGVLGWVRSNPVSES